MNQNDVSSRSSTGTNALSAADDRLASFVCCARYACVKKRFKEVIADEKQGHRAKHIAHS